MSRLRPRPIEWPTIALAVVIYGLWVLLTRFHALLPWPVMLAAGAWTVAWQSSLQHELIHGHPTHLPWLNRALGLPPLLLHLPFDRYRMLHLAHHRDERLTDPLDDPETQYFTPAGWRGLGPGGRFVVRLSGRLAGRLVVGPVWAIGRFIWREGGRLRLDLPGVRAAWAWHLPLLAAVLVWLMIVCRMSVLSYAACFWLPGMALLLLRSFAEHRAAPDADHRSAVIERAPVLGLLFLFNNLHAAHHERPGLAWYRLPRWYEHERARLVAKNGGLVYRGYAEVARRYLLLPHDQPVHPAFATVAACMPSCVAAGGQFTDAGTSVESPCSDAGQRLLSRLRSRNQMFRPDI